MRALVKFLLQMGVMFIFSFILTTMGYNVLTLEYWLLALCVIAYDLLEIIDD